MLYHALAHNTGTGTRITLTESDDLLVGQGVTVLSENGIGVQALGDGNSIHVMGTVAGHSYGIQVTAAPEDYGTNGLVRVASGGTVIGGFAGVSLTGDKPRVMNDGDIYGDTYGLILDFSGQSEITNRGTIAGGAVGVWLDSIYTSSYWSEALLTNFGRIEGGAYGVIGGQVVDRIVNRGHIDGDVYLGNSGDVFDNRAGTHEGTVYGQEADDTYVVGAGQDIFDGGDGLDTIDLRPSAGGRVSLLDGTSSGWADGDVYLNVERIQGSAKGADVLVGNDAANTLWGNGGNDRLAGGKGDDMLLGGAGADTLTGAAGNDVFRFNAPTEGADVITDFRNAAGNDDSIRISAFGFGGGLTGGGVALDAAQFQARADNLAQDADDRFVFRTTDATLWFDVDGKGGAAAVLIADLQAGAALTAADILLY